MRGQTITPGKKRGEGKEERVAPIGSAAPSFTPSPGNPGSSIRLRKSGLRGDRVLPVATFCVASIIPLVMLGMIGFLGYHARLSIQKFGFHFLVTQTWDPIFDEFGALPFIYGTLVTCALALLIAVPFGIGTAVFISELAPRVLRTPVILLSELLAAVPSVVYGLWGIFVLVPLVRDPIAPAIQKVLGFLPIFKGVAYGVGMFTAGLILAIMILPTISSVTREVLAAVPKEQREAALALGATRWESIRIGVLPYARWGMFGAVLLGLGRGLGEAMAVTMVIGNTPQIKASLFEPAYSLTSVLANEFTEAAKDLHLSALTEIALLLLGVSLVINICAQLLVALVVEKQERMKGRP